MDWEEPKKPVRTAVIGEDLTTLSVAELEERVGTLEAEIARVRQELATKRAHEAAASALFKR